MQSIPQTQPRSAKRSILSFLAGILGAAYAIYILSYIAKAGGNMPSGSAQAAGTAIGMLLILPHAIVASLAAFFNVLGWLGRIRWSTLVAGILYGVAALFMPLYAMFVLVQCVLCFIAFARMKAK